MIVLTGGAFSKSCARVWGLVWSRRVGLSVVGNDEAIPLCDLLGVQQLGWTDRFGFKLPRRFAVGFLGGVFAEELAADRDRRFVAGRRLDTLLADEAVGKALHGRRWRIRCGAVADCSTKQGDPSGGSAILELANDALRDVAHCVDRADYLLLADNHIVEQAFKLRRDARIDQCRIGLFEDAE